MMPVLVALMLAGASPWDGAQHAIIIELNGHGMGIIFEKWDGTRIVDVGVREDMCDKSCVAVLTRLDKDGQLATIRLHLTSSKSDESL